MKHVDLVMLVPTRRRPHAVAGLVNAFRHTCRLNTWLIWCIDDCPHREEYHAAVRAGMVVFPQMLINDDGERRGLVGTLNHYGTAFARANVKDGRPTAIGYLGDDHLPLTVGWDRAYVNTLEKTGVGIVYGDDQVQGANLPTQMAMTTNIVAALGYMAPPELWHMYCDNFWKDLGRGADCLTYLPEVTVTHRHPGVGRGTWDESYRETNSAHSYAADKAAYEAYAATRLPTDIATVRALRGDR